MTEYQKEGIITGMHDHPFILNYRTGDENLARMGLSTVKCYFPSLKEYGSYLNNIEEVKALFDKGNYKRGEIWYAADPVLVCAKDLHKYWTDEMMEYLRKAVTLYAKVSDDPIYREILEAYHWNEE